MNWINHTAKFAAVQRTALLFCAVFLSVNIGQPNAADIEEYIDEDGVLTIGADELTLDPTRYASLLTYLEEHGLDLTAIVIDEGGTLKIAGGTMVHVTGQGEGETKGNHILIKDDGTLIIVSSPGAGIYSGTPWEGDIAELQPDANTVLTIDGNGMIRIEQEDSLFLMANTIDVILQKRDDNEDEDYKYIGATIFVDTGTTIQSGTVTGAGSAVMTGEGTLRTGRVNMGGNFTVESGTVEFGDITQIGGDFILIEGTAKFDKTTAITGNFFVGTKDDDGNLISPDGDRNVHFSDTVTIGRNFIVESGTVQFDKDAGIVGNFSIGRQEVLAVDEAKDEHDEVIIEGVTGADAQEGFVDFFGKVEIGGTLDLQWGTVHLGGDAKVGALKVAEGTTLRGLEIIENDGEENTSTRNPDLIIEQGGTIAGTLENINRLTLNAGTLTFEAGEHSIESFLVRGTLELQHGVRLNGVPMETGDPEVEPEPNIILVGGTLLIGGEVGFYRGEDGDFEEDTPLLQVVSRGTVIVEEGVFFESGDVKWDNFGVPGLLGAGFIVSGGGTYRVGEVDLGTGVGDDASYFWLRNEKWQNGEAMKDNENESIMGETTVEFSGNVAAVWLFSDEGTRIFAEKDAVFDLVNIAGNYKGVTSDDGEGNQVNQSSLTILHGGWITGSVTDINKLELGGNLFLAIEDGVQTISTETWKFVPETSTQVRTVAGTESGVYHGVIRITDSEDRNAVLQVLNDSQTALYRPMWSPNQDDNAYFDLNLEILSVNEYIGNVWNKSGRNIERVGEALERLSWQLTDLRQDLEGLTDAQLERTLRTALAGELAGNAFRLAMHQPAHMIFRHLDTTVPLRSPFRTRGQVREGFHVWFNPYGQSERAKGEADTFDGYNLARVGFYVGGDIEIYNRAIFGTFFGYAAPSVKSDLGKISADDYTAGLYLRMPAVWDVVVNMMVGFGNQSYSYKQGGSNTDFRGNSLFGSVELSKPLPISNYRLTPLIAMDFQSVKMDAFVVRDPALGGVLIEPEDLSSAVLRVGLLGEAGRFRARTQYMRQVAGEDAVVSQTVLFRRDMAAATQIRGAQWGKDWLNVGVGGELLRTRHWRITADYDFDMGRRATSHLGSFNTVLTW